MARHDWFDEIGLSYCKHFDEVDAARDAFEQQRQALLDRLGEVARRSFKRAKSKVIGPPMRDGAWQSWQLKGVWVKRRHEAGVKAPWQSGVYYAIDRDPSFKLNSGDRFGFVAGIFFSMSQDRYNELRQSIADAAGDHHCAIDYWAGRADPSACIRSAWILPGDKQFKFSVFEAEIERLPGMFKKIDRAVGEAYRRSLT